jgi:uncharacterized membrane protein
MYPERMEADIFKYFDDSQYLFNGLWEQPGDYFRLLIGYDIDNEYFFDNYYIHMNNWDRAYDSNIYNDSHTIIRINAVIRLFSMGVYHVHSLFFCMFSMIGTVAIYRVVKKHFVNLKKILLLLLFFMPSLFIWTSGVLKEGILIMALGVMIFAINKVLQQSKRKESFVLILITLVLMLYIKFYVLIAFLPAIICFLVAHFTKVKKVFIYTGILACFGILVLNAKYIPPHVDMVKILERKQSDFKRLAEWQDAGSEFELTSIEPSFMGIAKVVPEGLLNCLIRPLPWNAKNVMYYPAIIENIIVLMLLFGIFLAFYFKEIYIKDDAKNLLWFCFIFTLLLFTIIGITTPVAGALVRYKVPALPFLIIGCLYLLQNSKNLNFIESKLPKF